jgi:hypothetical protein
MSANLKRRCLTVGQKLMISEKSLSLFKKEAERRRRKTWSKPGEKVGSEQHLERRANYADNSLHSTEPDENADFPPKPGKSSEQAGKAVGVIQGLSITDEIFVPERDFNPREDYYEEIIASVN